jgi:hypothetical protein
VLRAGLWPTSRQLVVALQLPGPRETRLHLRVDRTLDGREQLADYLARERYLEVVIPEPLHRFDAIAEHLHLRGVHVWLVPARLLDDIVALLAVRTSASVTLAAAIARLPTLPMLRSALRPLPPLDARQLRLALPLTS